ncbi:hypothetical protein KBD71_01965 [Candidatus Woesebacteria bacterium]|nr:hypothetical protein [Candidatus Woesebacteria bacterium]
MIKKELTHRSHHYIILIVGEALLLSAFLVFSMQGYKALIAVLVGVWYALWGVFTHQNEVKTTRLLLEYAAVGLLATVLLLSLIQII